MSSSSVRMKIKRSASSSNSHYGSDDEAKLSTRKKEKKTDKPRIPGPRSRTKQYHHSSSSSEAGDSGHSEAEAESSESDCMEPILVKTKRKKIKRDYSDSSGTGTGSGDACSSVGSTVEAGSRAGSTVRDNDNDSGSTVSVRDNESRAGSTVRDNDSRAGSAVRDNDSRAGSTVRDAGSTVKDNGFRAGSGSPSDISGKETAPVSPASAGDSSESDETRDGDDGSESSDTPEGQWEIEEIRDYIRDDFSEMYLVKWKDWEEHYNTWEPLTNLLNCEDEMMRFYRDRKKQHQDALDSSEYITLPNGKRRRKGPPLPNVPPDPRPLDIRVQEFFDVTGCGLEEKDILKVFMQWRGKKNNPKSRWPITKVDKYLEDGIAGKLTKAEMNELTSELIFLEVDKKNKLISAEMKEWEWKINSITEGTPYITVENDVDMSRPPIDFQFINNYVAGDGIEIPTDPPVGCSCGKDGLTCYDERSKCCAMQSGCKYAYTRYRKINLELGSPIFECNSKCQCGPECPNRVVQDGKSDHKLSIFRTSNGCGWGVKTLKSIKKGTFVTLYVGEVIKSEEADRRGRLYDKNGATYLFDLDFNDPDNYPYSVDASEYGNVSHFINHSCSPNLGVYAVWSDCLDPNLPKLAMFALRDISKNEELTFDYNRQSTPESRTKVRLEEVDDEDSDNENEVMKGKGKKTICLCGTEKCRKYIFY